MKHAYRFCNAALSSNIAIPELVRLGSSEGCTLHFELSAAKDWAADQSRLTPLWCRPDGTVWVSFQRQSNYYVIRVSDAAEFLVDADGGRISCFLLQQLPLQTLRHLLLDQILPLTLHLRGEAVLHASAITTDSGTAAFLGVAGSGKSTLCTFMAKNGSEILSDDCLVVKQSGSGPPLVFPSYPGVRLWPSSADALISSAQSFSPVAHYSDKRRIGAAPDVRFRETPSCLNTAFVIGPPESAGEHISVQPCSPKEALLELARYSFRLDSENAEALKREFWALQQMAVGLRVLRLNFPRRFSCLPAVREAVLAQLVQS